MGFLKYLGQHLSAVLLVFVGLIAIFMGIPFGFYFNSGIPFLVGIFIALVCFISAGYLMKKAKEQ